MDWSIERYVRLYTRDTADYLEMSWDATALWHQMLRKADVSGVVETPRGTASLAALVRGPLERVELAIGELERMGCVKRWHDAAGWVIPNYIEANETPPAPFLRKRKYRERRRKEKQERNVQRGPRMSLNVPEGNGKVTKVTPFQASPSQAKPTDQIPERSPGAVQHDAQIPPSAARGDSSPEAALKPAEQPVQVNSPPTELLRSKPKKPLTDEWQPRPQELALLAKRGVTSAEGTLEVLEEFRSYWNSRGGGMRDWDAAFKNSVLADRSGLIAKLARAQGPPKNGQRKSVTDVCREDQAKFEAEEQDPWPKYLEMDLDREKPT